jgi:hypothetical protein
MGDRRGDITEPTAASALKKPQRVPEGEVRPLAVGDPRLPASGLLLLPAAAAAGGGGDCEVAVFLVEVLPDGLLVVLCFTLRLEGALVRPRHTDPSCCGEELTLAPAAVVLLVVCLLPLRSLLALLLLLTSLLLQPPALLVRLLRLLGTPSSAAVRCFASRSVRPSARWTKYLQDGLVDDKHHGLV